MRKLTTVFKMIVFSFLIASLFLSPVMAEWWNTPIRLTPVGSFGGLSPIISGDGSKIAFRYLRQGGSYEIRVINSDGSGLSGPLATGSVTSISGDGSKIVFSNNLDGDYEIWVINSDGSGLRKLTNNNEHDVRAVISGDGSKIAFTASGLGNQPDNEIYLVHSDVSEGYPITWNSVEDNSPSISYDGSKITYQSREGNNDYEIFVWSFGSGPSVRLTTGMNPCISGDGSKIAFARDGEIWVINSDGSEENGSLAPGSTPSINYDGSKIAFYSGSYGDTQIFVVNSDGSNLKQLTGTTAEWNEVPSINYDGSKIAFSSSLGGGYNVYLVDAIAQLTVEVVGSGTTEPPPGSYGYDYDSLVSVYAQSAAGWMLDYWLVDGSHVGASNPFAVTMDVDHTLTGVFKLRVPPVAAFSYTPAKPKKGDTVTFDASSSYDDDGTITSYKWDFGDGNPGTGMETTHEYTDVGTYPVTLIVSDDDGLTDISIPKNVLVQEPPVAAFSYTPTRPKEGGTVTFDASSSNDSDGTITSYEWDFGDETAGRDMKPTHIYVEFGVYTVTLTITDNDGIKHTTANAISIPKPKPFPTEIIVALFGSPIILYFLQKALTKSEKESDSVKISESLKEKLSRSLTRPQAFEILDSADKSKLKHLDQLILVYVILESDWILLEAKKLMDWILETMENPQIISDEDNVEMGKAVIQAFNNPNFTESKKKKSEMLASALTFLPSLEDTARTMRLSFSDEYLAAYLLKEMYIDDRFYDASIIIQMIGDTGTGAFALNALARYMKDNSPELNPFKQAVQIAQEVLVDDFDSWYVSVRGRSYQNDLAEAERYREESTMRE